MSEARIDKASIAPGNSWYQTAAYKLRTSHAAVEAVLNDLDLSRKQKPRVEKAIGDWEYAEYCLRQMVRPPTPIDWSAQRKENPDA